MAFSDVADLYFIKSFIQIEDDDTTFDQAIENIIPFYTSVLTKATNDLDFDTLSDEDQNYLAGVLAVAIACHLMKSDRTYGMKYSGWQVGDAKKNFVRRYKTDYENWCDFYDDLMADVAAEYGGDDTDSSSTFRRSVTDDYDKPFAA